MSPIWARDCNLLQFGSHLVQESEAAGLVVRTFLFEFFLIYMFFFISSNFFVQLMVLPHVYCWNLKKLSQTASNILFKEIELLSVFTIVTCIVLWIVCHRNLHQRVSNANLAFWKKKRKIKSNHLVRFI